MDECPGTLFIWPYSLKDPSVEAIDAIDHQKLGRDLGQALRKYKQRNRNDLWEVVFHFQSAGDKPPLLGGHVFSTHPFKGSA